MLYPLLLFPAKKQQEEGLLKKVEKEAATSLTGLDLPDSLFVGKGIVGKWRLMKVSGGMVGGHPYDLSKTNATFNFQNNDTLVAISDLKLPGELAVPLGKFFYAFKVIEPTTFGGFKDFGGLKLINDKLWGAIYLTQHLC